MSDSTKADKPEIRLNKAIADSGYCARRKADELIANGNVKVNGHIVTEMGTKVDPKKDRITIQGKPLPKSEKYYLLLHKPTGYVTSRRGGRTQKTIYELLPDECQAADPAGRLDQDSSGALILSSDGDFLFKVTHPSFHIPKLYEIVLNHPLTPADTEKLLAGIRLMPEDKLAKMSKVLPDEKNPYRYRVELITGYNRQIRRSFREIGYRVQTLHRVAFGPIGLGRLPLGATRMLTEAEKARLLSSPTTPPKQGQHTTQKKDGPVKNHAQKTGKPQTKGQKH